MDALLSVCVIAHSSQMQTQTLSAPVGWLPRRGALRNGLVLQRNLFKTDRLINMIEERKYLTSPRTLVSPHMRYKRNGHKGGVFWFTGLSGSGKSTIAHAVEERLFNKGMLVNVLDGDVIRTGLCSDLSFSPEGRSENIRRIAELSRILALQGFICLCAFISPLKRDRDIARAILQDDFYEIFISCPLEECERRDVKGYYALAREGKIKNYTGISAPYDIPENPLLTVETHLHSKDACVASVQAFIEKNIVFR